MPLQAVTLASQFLPHDEGSRRIESRAASRAERARRTEELLLEADASTDEQRRDELLDEVVVVNVSVAQAIANRYRNRGVPIEDLEQAAYEGLVKAVHRYDVGVRPNLLTYAVPTIRGEIQRYFRDQSWVVRPPRRIQEMQWKVNRRNEELSQEMGREPTDAELAEDLGCTTAEVVEANQAFGCFNGSSLDRRVSESGTTLGELIADEADDGQDAVEARVTLAPVLRHLSARDRRILHLRFVEDQSQAEIGEELGVTQMQVSRLLQRILGEMRSELA